MAKAGDARGPIVTRKTRRTTSVARAEPAQITTKAATTPMDALSASKYATTCRRLAPDGAQKRVFLPPLDRSRQHRRRDAQRGQQQNRHQCGDEQTFTFSITCSSRCTIWRRQLQFDTDLPRRQASCIPRQLRFRPPGDETSALLEAVRLPEGTRQTSGRHLHPRFPAIPTHPQTPGCTAPALA